MLKTLQVAAFALMSASGSAFAAGTSSDEPASEPQPEETPSLYETAVERVEQRSFYSAIDLLEQVVADDPGNADAWNYLGFSLRQVSRYDEAFAAYDQALRIDPNHAGANEYLGELYIMTGDLDKAAAQLAILEESCGMSCSEYQQLKSAIEAAQ